MLIVVQGEPGYEHALVLEPDGGGLGLCEFS